MSTSAEPVPSRAGEVRFRQVGYADPVAQHLIEAVQQEYVVRYGGRDDAVVDPAEFTSPLGWFVVAEVDGVPAGCAGWRAHPYGDAGAVELKRLYVEPAFRGRGLAKRLLAETERTAAAAGYRRVVLNTGDRQPEAISLYERAGYRPVPGYGVYATSPDAVFLGRDLVAGVGVPDEPEEDAWAS
jgi:GNAT superfamily N-acetyltransferase